MEFQQHFSEVSSSEKTEAENPLLRLQHQRGVGAAIHLLRKKEMEPNQLLQQLNQLDTEIQHDKVFSESIQLIPSTSKSIITKSCNI